MKVSQDKGKGQSGQYRGIAKKVKDKSAIADYKRIQESYAKSQREIEELKKQLAVVKEPANKKKIEDKILKTEKKLQSDDWVARGRDYNSTFRFGREWWADDEMLHGRTWL
jgi:hypothetical protein